MKKVVETETEFFIEDNVHILSSSFKTEEEAIEFLSKNKNWFTEVVFKKWHIKEVRIVKRETVVTEEQIKTIKPDYFKEE